MNPHTTKITKTSTTLVGLALAAAMGAALGCSSSDGSPTPGTGGSGTGTAGTTASGGRGGTTGTGGTGTGGSTTGTGGTGTGGSATGTAGTTGTGGTGTGGSTAGTGGSTAGTGGSTAGTGGSTAGTGGSSTGGSGGGGAGGGGPVNLPPTLNPPAGATLKLSLHATGDQIYTCTASTGGAGGGGGAGGAGGSATTYSFVLKQPDAKLFTPGTTTQVGTHGLGPNWTSTVDNSVVNGARAYQENSPLSDAIPWLLLRATSNTGTGVFSDVTYVIRANTTGGKAPATGCDATSAGTDTKIAYTADYFFYNGGGPGTAWNTPPGNLPTAIQVPSGATYKLHDHAIGVQVYTCTAAAGGAGGGGGAGGAGGAGATSYSWVLKQPDAVLYDSAFAQVGTHGLGPNWTSTDGSVVNGTRVNGSNVTGTIAWLLLSATSNTGTGVFSDITYIQRLNTAGGVASGTCDATTVNTDTRIPYSADYYFFTGGVTVDGGTGG